MSEKKANSRAPQSSQKRSLNAPLQLSASARLVELAQQVAKKYGFPWEEEAGAATAAQEKTISTTALQAQEAQTKAQKATQDVAQATAEREEAATRVLERVNSIELSNTPEVRVAEINAAVARYKADVDREVSLRKIESDSRAAADRENSALTIERIKSDGATAIEEIRKEAVGIVEKIRSDGTIRTEGIKGQYVVLGALVTGALGALGGYNAASHSSEQAPQTASSQMSPARSNACEKSAEGKSYILKAATVFANLEIDSTKAPKRLDLDLRIVYTIKALRDIAKNEPAFVEQYTFRYAKGFEPWFGTERTIHTDGNNYQVMLDMRSGEERTISTGARFHYDWPLKDRKFFNDLISFAPDEFAVMYPNKDGDSICELNIVATSGTLELSAMDESAVRINEKSQVESSFKANVVPPSEAKRPFQRSITARWQDFLTKGTAFLRFKMRPTT